ncbi:MAG: glycosyltransferase family 4 protein [Candidatus Methanomethylicaceae archaeon]
MAQRIKIAYFVTPHTGGTFRTFQNLRKALSPLGYDMLAVSVGKMEWNGWWEEKLADESCVRLSPGESSLTEAVRALVNWIRELNVKFVIPMCNVVALSALPYLPSSCKVVSRVSSTSKMGLRLAVPDTKRISAIVAHTPGHLRELQKLDRNVASKVVFIPHGVDVAEFYPSDDAPLRDHQKLRLLYLGRLSIYDKGIDRLKPICEALLSFTDRFTLTVVGSGLDAPYLRRKLAPLQTLGLVEFQPAVLPERVPDVLRNHDVLIMPSRFEGFPNILIEAMACGVVPVASLLPGITDFIVDDGECGFLCAQDKPAHFARCLAELCVNNSLIKQMKEKAVEKVKSKFSLEKVGTGYDRLFRSLLRETRCDFPELPIPAQVPFHPLVRPRRLVTLRRKLRSVLARLGLWRR